MSESKVVFHLAKLTKGRKQGFSTLQVSFKAFHQSPSQCVNNCLKVYIDRIYDIRKMNGKQTKNQLLSAIVKPYFEVVSSTTARWLKNVMRDAGIDVSIVARFVRPALLRRRQRVFSQGDVDRANRSSASTFKTFYHKVIVQQYNNSDEAVLDINTGASRSSNIF